MVCSFALKLRVKVTNQVASDQLVTKILGFARRKR